MKPFSPSAQIAANRYALKVAVSYVLAADGVSVANVLSIFSE